MDENWVKIVRAVNLMDERALAAKRRRKRAKRQATASRHRRAQRHRHACRVETCACRGEQKHLASVDPSPVAFFTPSPAPRLTLPPTPEVETRVSQMARLYRWFTRRRG